MTNLGAAMSSVALSATTRSRIEEQIAGQTAGREKIIEHCGSIASFLDGLSIEVIDTPSSPLLQPFYALYERCFPLEEEREPLEGFKTVLAFNTDDDVQGLYGPIHEFVLVVRVPGSDTCVAAANFAVHAYPEPQRAPGGFDGSCQLNFLCVEPSLRAIGLGQFVLGEVDRIVRRTLANRTGRAAPRYFTTIEQNNPLRMSGEQIEEDAAAALIDPYDRLRWWSRRGYRKLDFSYVQPPLSLAHEPCLYIDYYVRFSNQADAASGTLDAAVLLEHLRRFFFVSVGKFEIDMARNPQWISQRAALERVDTVAVLAPEAD